MEQTTIERKTSTKPKVAAYCRVSTEQEEQAGSFENQVTTYRQRITSNPDWEFAGIYADDGISGTRADRRTGFMKMLQDCRDGKIDRILTKSISRFSRNVIDSLKYTRQLKELGVGIDFEEEHINSLDPGAEMIFTILSAVAEQEARNISEHTKWGLRSGYQRGVYKNPASLNLYGYEADKEGNVIVNAKEAETVQTVFKNYLEGMLIGEIAKNLNMMGIPTRKGTTEWQAGQIKGMLANEKYKGDVLLQKSYVSDFMEHKAVKNNGEVEQYYLKDAHPAIVDRDMWDAVALEMKRRDNLRDIGGQPIRFNSANVYSGKVFLKGGCQALLTKNAYGAKKDGGKGGGTWRCKYMKRAYHPVCHNPFCTEEKAGIYTGSAQAAKKVQEKVVEKKELPDCFGIPINDKFVKKFFQVAWNSILDDDLQKTRLRWTAMTNDKEVDPLRKVRAQQMLDLTAPGAEAKIYEDVPEIVRMVLDRIEVIDCRYADVFFLDGTVKRVELASEWE